MLWQPITWLRNPVHGHCELLRALCCATYGSQESVWVIYRQRCASVDFNRTSLTFLRKSESLCAKGLWQHNASRCQLTSCRCTKGWTMTLARLPWGISRSPERLMMAVYAIGVPALAVLLFAVRPAKHKGGGHIDDQRRGSGRDGSRLLQPTKLDILMDGA